jgi:hypothetical protein
MCVVVTPAKFLVRQQLQLMMASVVVCVLCLWQAS